MSKITKKIPTDKSNQKIKLPTIEFPITILPEQYQVLVKKFDESFNAPQAYTSLAILFAYSTLVGSKVKIRVKDGYEDVPMIWVAAVGEPGVNKTHGINKILNPIKAIDKKSHENYQTDLSEWQIIENNPEPKPVYRQHLVDNFTPEVLAHIFNFNPKGVGLNAKEIPAWLSTIDRYGKGESISMFLSIFDGDSFTVNRVTKEPLVISNTFLSLIGTIQPELLLKIFEKHSSSGFFDRFLFSIVEHDRKLILNNHMDLPELERYSDDINQLNEFVQSMDNICFRFQDFQDFVDIQSWLIDKEQQNDFNVRMKSYISKLMTYIPRLAALLQFVHTRDDIKVVTTETMKKTFDLIKYFFDNAAKLLIDFNNIKEMNSIIGGLKTQTQKAAVLKKEGYSYEDIAKCLNISIASARTMVSRVRKKG